MAKNRVKSIVSSEGFSEETAPLKAGRVLYTVKVDTGMPRVTKLPPPGPALSVEEYVAQGGSLSDLRDAFNHTVRPIAYVKRVRSGEPRNRVDEIASILGLSDKEMAKVLTISERTLHRMVKPLDSNQTERLLLLEDLIKHGLDVFDGRKNVLLRWLREPRPSLGNVSPMSILDTIVGFQLVDTELTRIEEGSIS